MFLVLLRFASNASAFVQQKKSNMETNSLCWHCAKKMLPLFTKFASGATDICLNVRIIFRRARQYLLPLGENLFLGTTNNASFLFHIYFNHIELMLPTIQITNYAL